MTPGNEQRSGTAARDAAPGSAGLDAARLRAALLTPGSMWSAVNVVAETGSTNEDLIAAARAGAAHGTVLAAEQQVRGRGRQGRTWTSAPGGALTFSVLLRPAVPPAALSWLPLLAGVAAVRAIRALTSQPARGEAAPGQSGAGVDAVLKWPNDVLAGGGKLAGILAELAGDAVVIGIGINVGGGPADLPPARPGALPPTSLALCGAPGTDRTALLAGLLGELAHWHGRWAAAGGDPDACGLRAEYLRHCATVGSAVRVELPGDAVLDGIARGIDPAGRLLVDAGGTVTPVSAGDVVHVRPR